MPKKLFETLMVMNQNDIDNDTKTLRVANQVIAAEKIKQGGKVTFGVDGETVMDIISSSVNDNKYISLMLVIDKSEFEKIQNS